MAKRNVSVKEIDFGYEGVEELWSEIVIPEYERFLLNQNRATAISASMAAWHVHEWIWYENNPGIDVSDPRYRTFCDRLVNECEQLGWVRYVANGAKHRYLRKSDVQRMGSDKPIPITVGGQPVTFGGCPLVVGSGLQIELTDGTKHNMAVVLDAVIKFWRDHFEGRRPIG